MRFAPIFQDHAVLQRDLPIPVWGQAKPQATVVVSLQGQEARVICGNDGNWLVRLPPMPAGGPYTLTARCNEETISCSDIVLGEVWICSGQSNMQWLLQQTNQHLEVDPAKVHTLRLLTIGTPACLGRQTAVDGAWTIANDKSLLAFSAVGGWFGRRLHAELGVPVGLICNAWGGTRIQAWTSREALLQHPAGLTEVLGYEAYAYRKAEPSGLDSPPDWRALDSGNRGLAEGWASTNFDDSAWEVHSLPSRWQDHGHRNNGIFWYRKTLAVPVAWRGKDLRLSLGAVDKHDDTYVNGQRVGGLSWEDGEQTWNTPRVYTIPGALVGETLCIAVRARSHLYHGGCIGPASIMQLGPLAGGTTVQLDTDWRAQREQDWGVQVSPTQQLIPGAANAPFTLFDSRLWPIIPYGIRGVIWYQGESNAGEPSLYRSLLPLMIEDWRRAWGQGDFAFLQVQLANYQAACQAPQQSNWAELRDAQRSALHLPNTGLAVAIDVGEAKDIHPLDKRTVGERLAQWALFDTYHRGSCPSGPQFVGLQVESGNRIRCQFRYAQGLATRDGKAPARVQICSFDQQWRWAETAIDGETLLAWHPEIQRPVAVRYAWADNPEGCNLINAQQLPAIPFRSDDWPH